MSDKEYEHVENKLSLSERHEGTIAIAAFATARGGTVYFGIAPDGRRAGVRLGRTSLEELANYIRQNTDPPQFPSILTEGEESSAIISVRVEESPIKPVWAFGKPYKRVGRINQAISRNETKRLVEQTTGRTWDALPCAGLTESALDRTAVVDYLKRAGQNTSSSTESVLENLRLRLPDGSLCNAAALLFASRPWRFVTGAQVKCGRFSGVSSVDFLDERTLEGHVFTQIDEALGFIARNIRHGILITGQPEREIVPEYPEEALREAVVNAVCHRDYAAPGTVQVRIYDDRLEVWNPATLAADFEVEQLYREHASRPRNRLLADACYRARLIEQWGTGTLRMVRAFESRGLARPEFLYEGGIFTVRFESPPVQTVRRHMERISERQVEALAHMTAVGPMTRRQYAEKGSISERQALRDLDDLIHRGFVVRDGRGSLTRYFAA